MLQCKAQNKRLEEESYTLGGDGAAPAAAPAPAAAAPAAPAAAAAASAGKADLADVFTSVRLHFMNLPKNVLDPVKRYFIAYAARPHH